MQIICHHSSSCMSAGTLSLPRRGSLTGKMRRFTIMKKTIAEMNASRKAAA